MSRSTDAFEMSIDHLQKVGRLHLWTFTFADVLTVKQGSACWSAACRELVERCNGLCGVRVFEMHKNHGLHIHAVIAGRWPIRLVRDIFQSHGFGRIHVCRITKNPYYIGKYLSESRRHNDLKGSRLWQCFGGRESKKKFSVKCKNIEYRGFGTRSYYVAKEMFPFLTSYQALQASSVVRSAAYECDSDLTGNIDGVVMELASEWYAKMRTDRKRLQSRLSEQITAWGNRVHPERIARHRNAIERSERCDAAIEMVVSAIGQGMTYSILPENNLVNHVTIPANDSLKACAV